MLQSLLYFCLSGTTAKKIAVVGDSAGGNLLLATMLHAIQDNIRLPDGIVAVYTPTYIQFIPSPSRTLSIMDALLPVGILTTCLEGMWLTIMYDRLCCAGLLSGYLATFYINLQKICIPTCIYI